MRVFYFFILYLCVLPKVFSGTSAMMNAHDEQFLIGQFPGSKLVSQHNNPFIEMDYLTELNTYTDPETWGKELVSGENTVAVYSLKKDRVSTRVVFNSLVKTLEGLGAQAAIQCSGVQRECGYYFPRRLTSTHLRRDYYSAFNGFTMLNYGDFYFYSGSLEQDGERYYLALTVASEGNDNVQYSVDILRSAQDESEELVLATDQIKASIQETGKAILGGLFFEVNETKLMAASNDALKGIAEYLNNNKDVQFYVVGHTDASGEKDYNLRLSDGRANQVVGALVAEFDVEEESLTPVGMGFFSPIDTNNSPEGRANNRRVELVLVSSDEGEKVKKHM